MGSLFSKFIKLEMEKEILEEEMEQEILEEEIVEREIILDEITPPSLIERNSLIQDLEDDMIYRSEIDELQNIVEEEEFVDIMEDLNPF